MHTNSRHCVQNRSAVVWPGWRLHLGWYNYPSVFKWGWSDPGSVPACFLALLLQCFGLKAVGFCWRTHHIIQSEAGSRRFWSFPVYTSPSLQIPNTHLNPKSHNPKTSTQSPNHSLPSRRFIKAPSELRIHCFCFSFKWLVSADQMLTLYLLYWV